jgi:hypothetical protein
MPAKAELTPAGWTPRELARRWRISPDRVRSLVRSGQLPALNLATARCGKPRLVITAEAVAEFERTRQAAPPPAPVKRRKRMVKVDYYRD